MTLQEMLDEVLLLSGMGTETAYATSTDDAVLRLVTLANQAAISIAQFEWQGLRAIYSFTMTASDTYPLPDDYKAFIPDTMFVDGTLVDIPTGTTTWNYLDSIAGASGALWNMRLMGDLIHVYGPVDGTEVRFEYSSKYPVLDASEAPKARFTADTDTFRLDDELLIKETLWRYKKLMGLADWQVDAADAKAYERYAKGNDKSAKTITPCASERQLGDPYTPLWV